MARGTSTPKIKWLAYTYAKNNYPACGLTTTPHYFHYDLCVNLVDQVYPSLVVNHSIESIYTLAYLLVCFRCSAGFRFSSSAENRKAWRTKNAENRYPWRTIHPKIDPWRTYAQFEKLNGSPSCNAHYSLLGTRSNPE